MAGYLRLRQICLVAPRLEPVISDIAEIMGLSVCYRDGNVAKYGLENALLPVDTILLEVVTPFQPGTAAGRFLDKTGGRGGYMAIFCCDDPDARGKHAKEIGVRVANTIDHAPYHGVQLHPRDCRAALQSAGFDVESRPYQPHCTLGRPRTGWSEPARQAWESVRSEPLPLLAFCATRVVLYESRTAPGGAVYTEHTSLPLSR